MESKLYFHELGNYSNNYGGWQIFDNFAEGRYYDQDGNLVDLGKNITSKSKKIGTMLVMTEKS